MPKKWGNIGIKTTLLDLDEGLIQWKWEVAKPGRIKICWETYEEIDKLKMHFPHKIGFLAYNKCVSIHFRPKNLAHHSETSSVFCIKPGKKPYFAQKYLNNISQKKLWIQKKCI